jgi:hypothetical protein
VLEGKEFKILSQKRNSVFHEGRFSPLINHRWFV